MVATFKKISDLMRQIHFRRSSEESSQDGIDATFLDEAPRSEEGFSKREVSLLDGLEVGVESFDDRVDQGVTCLTQKMRLVN